MDKFEKALDKEVKQESHSPTFEKGAIWAKEWIFENVSIIEYTSKLRTENQRLREALEIIADSSCAVGGDDLHPSIARQALSAYKQETEE